MLELAQMPTLDVWYAHLSDQDILAAARATQSNKKQAKEVKRTEKNIKKARTRDSLQALSNDAWGAGGPTAMKIG